MKRTSIISAIVFVSVLILLSFTFTPDKYSGTIPTKNSSEHIKVHVTGCDDCNNLKACVNGTTEYTPGKRDFEVECYPLGADIQTICVKCGEKIGTGKIECGYTKEIEINLTSTGVCPCD